MAQTPIATLNWNRTPNSDTFNAQAFLPFAVVSPGAGVANTAIQAGFLAPTLFKIRKVAVFYTAINTVSGIDAFNIVVGTGAYTQGVIAPNDNSFASNTQPTPTGTTMGNGVYSASNGVGYPKTNWLLKDGAKNEEKFKYFLRRHQLPTEVWYDATPSLTAYEMERNSRIRDGIQRQSMTDAELSDWIKLF